MYFVFEHIVRERERKKFHIFYAACFEKNIEIFFFSFRKLSIRGIEKGFKTPYLEIKTEKILLLLKTIRKDVKEIFFECFKP